MVDNKFLTVNLGYCVCVDTRYNIYERKCIGILFLDREDVLCVGPGAVLIYIIKEAGGTGY